MYIYKNNLTAPGCGYFFEQKNKFNNQDENTINCSCQKPFIYALCFQRRFF